MSCPICLESCVRISTLSCGHEFCNSCITRWSSEYTGSCPLCRASLSIASTRYCDDDLRRLYQELNSGELLQYIQRNPLITEAVVPRKNENADLSHEERVLIERYLLKKPRGVDISPGNIDVNQYYAINFKRNGPSIVIGKCDSKYKNNFKLKDVCVLQRDNGWMYNASPSYREYNIYNNDIVYLLE